MLLEKISVAPPGAGSHLMDVPVKPDEGDEEIALRLAKGFQPGTVLGIAGSKWVVESREPPQVRLRNGKPPEEPEDEEAPPESTSKPGVCQRCGSELIDGRCPKATPLTVDEASEGGTLPSPASSPEPVIEPLVATIPNALLKLMATPRPGEVWRPRDPRRKATFTVKAVTDTEVVAEDGRSIQLDRMKRYERVS